MKDEITIHVNVSQPSGVTREQAIEQGRQIQRGMQFAMQRRYVPGRDVKITRPADDRSLANCAAKATDWFQNGTITYTSGPVSAMRMDKVSGFYGFTTVDLSTGAEIANVVWADDTTLEYATLRLPYWVDPSGVVSVDVHKVTAVRVDYVNKRIELNTLPAQTPWPFPTSEPKACHECHQPETCKRIDFCAAHKCRFGEDDAP